MYWFRLFHWSLFLRVQLTIFCIGSDYGLAPPRCQAIIWTNDGLVYWRIYASLSLDELSWYCIQHSSNNGRTIAYYHILKYPKATHISPSQVSYGMPSSCLVSLLKCIHHKHHGIANHGQLDWVFFQQSNLLITIYGKHQNSALLALWRGIHPWLVDSPHKGPVMQEVFSMSWHHHVDSVMTGPYCIISMAQCKTAVTPVR